MDHASFILALIVLLSYTTQALSGFGSTIIAVTLGVHLYPIESLLPVLVPLDVLLNTYIVTRHRVHVQRPLLVRRMLPLVGLGLLIGIGLFNFLHSGILRMVFGVFVVALSLRELYLLFMRKHVREPLGPVWEAAWFVTGGIVQGVFASGGPPVVYAAGRIIPRKAEFRSTLAALWIAMNLVLLSSYITTGLLTRATLITSALLLPVVLLSIVLGERLHDHVNEYSFRIIVFALLLVAGISVLVR